MVEESEFAMRLVSAFFHLVIFALIAVVAYQGYYGPDALLFITVSVICWQLLQHATANWLRSKPDHRIKHMGIVTLLMYHGVIAVVIAGRRGKDS